MWTVTYDNGTGWHEWAVVQQGSSKAAVEEANKKGFWSQTESPTLLNTTSNEQFKLSVKNGKLSELGVAKCIFCTNLSVVPDWYCRYCGWQQMDESNLV